MTSLNFTHFEAFGGALVNNFIGLVSNLWTTVTGGMFSDPLVLAGAFAFFIFMFFAYTLLSTGSFEKATKIIIDMDDPFMNNALVKGLILLILFHTLMKPIPVVQMTPIVGYTNEASTAGVSEDRIILGWLVNDMKTTTTWASPTLGSATTNIAPGKSGNQEIMYVPQVFALLSWIEDIYYGFPDVINSEIFVENTTTGKLTYHDPTAAVTPTLMSCVTDRTGLVSMENNILARIDMGDIGNFSETCQTNLKTNSAGTPGIWRESVQDSIIVTLFGEQSVSEILTDFFEPIDRFFYYMTLSSFSELVIERLEATMGTQISITSANEMEGKWSDNKADFQAEIKKKIYNSDKEIYESIVEIKAKMSALSKYNGANATPKESMTVIRDIVLNYRNIENGWRKNQSDSYNDLEKLAIPKVTHRLSPSTTASPNYLANLLDAEIEVIKNNGLYFKEENLKPLVIAEDALINGIYDEGSTAFGVYSIDYDIQEDSFPDEKSAIAKITAQWADIVGDPREIATIANVSIDTELTETDSLNTDTNQYKEIHQDIWAARKAVISRQLLLKYVVSLKDRIKGLHTKITEDKKTCETPQKNAFQSPADIADCVSNEFLKWSSVQIQKDPEIKLPMVYLGAYPSLLYLTAGQAVTDADDKTQSVLFLPVTKVLDNLSNIAILEAYQKPLVFLSEIFPTNIWEKTSFDETQINFLKTNTYLAPYMKKTDGLSFVDPNKVVTGQAKVYTGVSTGSNSILSRWKGDGSVDLSTDFNNVITAAGFDTGGAVTISNDNPNFSKFHDFVGRNITLQRNGEGLTVDFIAARNTFKTSFAKELGAKNVKARKYVASFKNMILSLKNYTEVRSSTLVVFDKETRESLAGSGIKVIYGGSTVSSILTLNELETTSFIKILDGMIAFKYKNAIDMVKNNIESYVKSEEASSDREKEIAAANEYNADIEQQSNAEIKTAISVAKKEFSKLVLTTQNKLRNVSDEIGITIRLGSIEIPLPPTIIGDYSRSTSKGNIEHRLGQLTALHLEFKKPGGLHTAAQIKIPPTLIGSSILKEVSLNRAMIGIDNTGGLWPSIVRSVWQLATIPMNFLREFQNTASVKVSDYELNTNDIYNPEILLGAFNSDEKKVLSGGIISQSSTGYDFTNPNYLIPSLDSSVSDVWNNLKEMMSVGGILTTIGIGVVLTGLGLTTVFVGMILTFIMAMVIGLASMVFAMIFRTVSIFVLGIAVGIMGFFNATIWFPLSLFIWSLTYDYKKKDTVEELKPLLRALKVNPSLTFWLAIRQLSGWMVAITVMVAIISIDHNFLEPIQKSISFEAWLGEMMGSDIGVLRSYMVSFVLGGFYILLLIKGYSLIEQYFKKQTVDDPALSAAKKMVDDTKTMWQKLNKKGK
jgi:hypothetical protein